MQKLLSFTYTITGSYKKLRKGKQNSYNKAKSLRYKSNKHSDLYKGNYKPFLEIK